MTPSAVLLGDLALVLVTARLAGAAFRRIGQPAVIGEVIAGLLLGPTLLGSWSAVLFPPAVRPALSGLAELGVVLFVFLLGLELDPTHLRGRHGIAAGVAVGGTLLPLAGGMALGWALWSAADGVDLLPFALFFGVSLSITAFPVLARILSERGLAGTPLGVLAMTCAAGDDVLTWAALALVIAIASASGIGGFLLIVAETVAFAVLLLGVVRPLLARHADRVDAAGAGGLVLLVAFALACSWVTAWIGVHSILGAFLAGAVVPRKNAAVAPVALRSLTLVLLPVFFVATGLNVDLRHIGASGLVELAAILAVAVGGKVLGASVPARLGGLASREALGLGVLMNTRGLTELIVLEVGRQAGLLSMERYGLLVVMAVVTTVATAPLLGLVRPDPDLPVSLHLLRRRGGDAPSSDGAGAPRRRHR